MQRRRTLEALIDGEVSQRERLQVSPIPTPPPHPITQIQQGRGGERRTHRVFRDGLHALDQLETSWHREEQLSGFEVIAMLEDELLSKLDGISPSEYIQWVQRSLNRVLNLGLPENGVKNENYVSGGVSFQMKNGLKPDGIVGPSTQNALIKANEGVKSYMKWVHGLLESVRIYADPPRQSPVNGSYKSYGMRLGIREFQKQRGLTVDGFVGAKTDTTLRRLTSNFPTPIPSPVEPTSKPAKPLGIAEMEGAVYLLLGKSPQSDAKRTLLKDAIKFVKPFVTVLDPTKAFPWAALAHAYLKVLIEIFKDQERAYWYMIGSAYAAVDIAPRNMALSTMKYVPRNVLPGFPLEKQPPNPDKFRVAVRDGYLAFRRMQAESAKTPVGSDVLRVLRGRIEATPSKARLVRGAFIAFRSLYLDQNPRSTNIRTRGIPCFRYPTLGETLC